MSKKLTNDVATTSKKVAETKLEQPKLKPQLKCNEAWKVPCEDRYKVYATYHQEAWADVVAGKRRLEQYKIRLVETYTLYENSVLMSYVDNEKLPEEVKSIYDRNFNYNGKNTRVVNIEVKEGDKLTDLMVKYASVKGLSDKLQNAATKLGLTCNWDTNKVEEAK